MAPELGERLEAPPGAAQPAPDQARFEIVNSLATLLREAGEAQPLLLALDDVHAADADALFALQFLAQELQSAHVLGLATYQEAPVRQRPDAEAIFGSLARTCQRIMLGGLSQDELALLIEQRSGTAPPPNVVPALAELTAGNPFFAIEVVRTLTADGRLGEHPELAAAPLPLPSGVRDAIERRLAGLPEETRRVLATAAVSGREFRVALVGRAAGIDRSELLEAFDHAIDAGLVVRRTPAAATMCFTHGLVRETIYAGLSTRKRAALHRAVGEAMELLYEGDLDSRLAELAHHFVESALDGDPVKAVDYASRAGLRAARTFAWEEAARLFGGALATLGQSSSSSWAAPRSTAGPRRRVRRCGWRPGAPAPSDAPTCWRAPRSTSAPSPSPRASSTRSW
jgi:predicted ATPase